ncbi:MAG: HXXEE domain-containing protein [Planctomycetota bacterium]
MFLALVGAQALHSIEEVLFRLYEVFAPARFVSELVSSNPAIGFAMLNAGIVAFGVLCYVAWIRPGTPSARMWLWLWAVVELVNGIVHSAVAVVRGGYFPGVVTAPILIVIALFLGRHLLRLRGTTTVGEA